MKIPTFILKIAVAVESNFSIWNYIETNRKYSFETSY